MILISLLWSEILLNPLSNSWNLFAHLPNCRSVRRWERPRNFRRFEIRLTYTPNTPETSPKEFEPKHLKIVA